MISNGIRVYNCYNLDGNNATVNVIREAGSIKMFPSFQEKSSRSPDSPLHSYLIHLDLWLQELLYIVMKPERSFKIVVAHEPSWREQGVITNNALGIFKEKNSFDDYICDLGWRVQGNYELNSPTCNRNISLPLFRNFTIIRNSSTH